MNEGMVITIACPKCGEVVKVTVGKHSVTADFGRHGKTTRTRDRPDGGPRGESQQEYLGVK